MKAEVYYYVTDKDNYFDVTIYSEGAIILGLTENGNLSLASTKKLIIPKEIIGTDGRNHKVTAVGDNAFEENANIEWEE